MKRDAPCAKGELREYGLPGKRCFVLVCGKCQRKVRRAGKANEVGRLKRALKERTAKDGVRVRAIEVGCLKVCPKGGVTVCTGEQLGRNVYSILWDGADIDALYERVQSRR